MRSFKNFAICFALALLAIYLWPVVIAALIIRMIVLYRRGVHAERARHVVVRAQQPRITYQ